MTDNTEGQVICSGVSLTECTEQKLMTSERWGGGGSSPPCRGRLIKDDKRCMHQSEVEWRVGGRPTDSLTHENECWKVGKYQKNLGEDSRRRSVLTSVWANLLATKFFSTFGNKQQEGEEDAREMRFSFSLDLFGHMLSIWPEWKKKPQKSKKKGSNLLSSLF